MLGKCMYFCKQYHRAAKLITQAHLDEVGLLHFVNHSYNNITQLFGFTETSQLQTSCCPMSLWSTNVCWSFTTAEKWSHVEWHRITKSKATNGGFCFPNSTTQCWVCHVVLFFWKYFLIVQFVRCIVPCISCEERSMKPWITVSQQLKTTRWPLNLMFIVVKPLRC